MSRCEQYEPYLAAMADGDLEALPAEIRQPLRAHVEACAACQREIAAQAQVARRFRQATPPPVSDARWRSVWDAVEAETADRAAAPAVAGPLRLWSPWRTVTAAAAMAAMILLGALLWTQAPSNPGTMTLADGSGDTQPAMFAFASQDDSDIEVIEAFGDNETPVVITTGQEDLVVVWMLHDEESREI